MKHTSKAPIKFEGVSFNEVWIKSIKTETEFVNHPANANLWDDNSRANKLKELYKIAHGKKKDAPEKNESPTEIEAKN